MAVTYQQLHPGNNGLATYGIAKELARQTTVFYAAVTGIGVGLGGGSCRAAVAIAPDFQFAAANAITGWAVPAAVGNMAAVTTGGALPYGIAFGNSQLARAGFLSANRRISATRSLANSILKIITSRRMNSASGGTWKAWCRKPRSAWRWA